MSEPGVRSVRDSEILIYGHPKFRYINCVWNVKNLFTLGPFTLAKTKIQKTWVFCCTVYTARKTHNIRGVFWHEKRMREKTRISYWCFGKWCACATSLYLWPYTCSAHYVAGRGRVIPLKVTYHVTKNLNNTLWDWSRRLHWQNTPEKPAEFQKILLWRWVFRFGFFAVFRGSCLATSHKIPECTKDSGFLMHAHPELSDLKWNTLIRESKFGRNQNSVRI